MKILTMKFCFSFLFLLSTLISFSQKKELPVKIIEATQQTWVSGAPGGKTGTKYSIKVYINTKRKTEFKNIWIGKMNVLFDVEFFSLDIQKKIEYGDSLLITYNKIYGVENENAETKRLPLNYKGAALMEVAIDGKARYFIVKNFKQVASLGGQ